MHEYVAETRDSTSRARLDVRLGNYRREIPAVNDRPVGEHKNKTPYQGSKKQMLFTSIDLPANMLDYSSIERVET